MGVFETTMGKIMGAKSQILEVKLEGGGKNAGIILRALSKQEPESDSNSNPGNLKVPTMVDYLRSGWQFNLAVAIDYTASNGDLADDDCLHFMGP